MSIHSVEARINDQTLTIETGKVAKQADGAVTVRCGDTVVLSTVCATKSPLEGRDFLPLTVEYREKSYAGGRIPGGFFKREGRPDEKETLTCRLIDRPLRPLFPKGFRNEIQIINLVVSADDRNDPDVLAMVGSSCAVALSGLPFEGPVGAVRVAMVDGQLVANPTYQQIATSPLEIVIAGTEAAVLMVEAGARERGEEEMLKALEFGSRQCRELARIQKELVARAGKPRWAVDREAKVVDTELLARVKELATPRVVQALSIHEKHPRAQALATAFDEVRASLGLDEAGVARARELFDKVEKAEVRRLIVEKGIRVDGRSVSEVRPIWSEVGALPRAHGSALFTRGETQALVTATLGTKDDEQKIDVVRAATPTGTSCCTTTSRPSRRARSSACGRPGAARSGTARSPSAPSSRCCRTKVDFPYTIRIVSEILESNGSSSMATRLRRLAGPHGRRRPDQGAGRRHRHGPGQGG